MRVQKPSRIVCELQSGIGATRPSDPVIPRGLALPGSYSEDEVDEIMGAAWGEEDGMSVLREDWEGAELAFVAETTDAEALEPRTFARAKCCPDWPLWEKAIEEELASLNAAETWTLTF
jgi:hypothetical protein